MSSHLGYCGNGRGLFPDHDDDADFAMAIYKPFEEAIKDPKKLEKVFDEKGNGSFTRVNRQEDFDGHGAAPGKKTDAKISKYGHAGNNGQYALVPLLKYKNKYNVAVAGIFCRDYAAYGVIKVDIVPSDNVPKNLKNRCSIVGVAQNLGALLQGDKVKGASAEKVEGKTIKGMQIVIDKNPRNGIADCAGDYNAPPISVGQDDEDGIGINWGDGITWYEEYRGFITIANNYDAKGNVTLPQMKEGNKITNIWVYAQNGLIHLRTNPQKKTLFVKLGEGIHNKKVCKYIQNGGLVFINRFPPILAVRKKGTADPNNPHSNDWIWFTSYNIASKKPKNKEEAGFWQWRWQATLQLPFTIGGLVVLKDSIQVVSVTYTGEISGLTHIVNFCNRADKLRSGMQKSGLDKEVREVVWPQCALRLIPAPIPGPQEEKVAGKLTSSKHCCTRQRDWIWVPKGGDTEAMSPMNVKMAQKEAFPDQRGKEKYVDLIAHAGVQEGAGSPNEIQYAFILIGRIISDKTNLLSAQGYVLAGHEGGHSVGMKHNTDNTNSFMHIINPTANWFPGWNAIYDAIDRGFFRTHSYPKRSKGDK